MKKLIFLVMTIVALITTSCSKAKTDDFTKPENLSGTTWKCALVLSEDIEYYLMIFTSTTTVEAWTKYIGEAEDLVSTCSYTISNDRISISHEDIIQTGIIDGETITTTVDDKTCVFYKQ
jgi:hypothetical protein